jgi:hypothetical protein
MQRVIPSAYILTSVALEELQRGDAEWLRGMIMNPTGVLRYGAKNRMPT